MMIRMIPSSQMKQDIIKAKLQKTLEILLDHHNDNNNHDQEKEHLIDVLLRPYKYSHEALLEAYTQNPEQCLRQAGVYHRFLQLQSTPTTNTNTTTMECPICYETSSINNNNFYTMPCGHSFCLDCWYLFLSNAVQEGPHVVMMLTCPQADCTERVLEPEFERLLLHNHNNNNNNNNQLLWNKYQSYRVRAFVDANPLTRWCPGPGCESIACAPHKAALEQAGQLAHCSHCALTFCVSCGHPEPHAPTSCRELALWTEKCRNESETANWILANTKCCPKCNSRIEKNQGCNHMTCQRCAYEFCWICMGDWKQHGANTGGYYKCNKYDQGSNSSEDDNNNSEQSEAAKAKRDLDRYLHYYKRYHAHKEAEAFAKKQLMETETRMVKLQESKDIKWADVEFLKTANEQLVECRRVLKYTYVFAYYLHPHTRTQRERFEHHQEMLERFTEHLSHLVEKPIQEMDRQDVVNQTRVVSQFLKNILAYVADGMEE